MASAPPAEWSGWRRKAALTAITIALVTATYHPICNLVAGCGCSTIFTGGTDTCDIHVAGPPDCPVCTNVAAGIVFSAALVAAWGAVVSFAARRFRPRPL